MHIIHIDKGNIEAFSDYLPDNMKHSVSMDDCLILGAVDEGSRKMAGVLISSTEGDQSDLQWLFVNPDFRRRKYASKLVDMALSEIMQSGAVSEFIAEYQPEKAEGLEDFFDDHDFDIEDADLPSYEICINDLKLPDGIGMYKSSQNVINIKTLPLSVKNDFAKSIRDIYTLAAVKVPLEWRMFDQDLSIVTVADNEVHGALLVDTAGEKPEIAYGFSSPKSPYSFMELLGSFLSRVEEKYGRDRKLLVSSATEEADALVRKLAPGVERLKIRRAVYTFDI